MLRGFVGAFAADGRGVDVTRFRRALEPEGDVSVLESGSLTVVYTGPPSSAVAPDAPICLLDGTVYEAIGLDLPARSGPELEAFLARAYVSHGDDLLPSLRGEFALLLFDPGREAGVVARDQMGARGAFWTGARGQVLFATEYRPLLAALPRRPSPDPVSVSHWLVVSGLPRDRTLYEGVRRVEAGCALHLGGADPATRRFWSLEPAKPLRGERAELALLLRGALERAVERRIAPGEQTGVLLSGGLDSGSVAALAGHASGGPRLARAYSAVFPDHESVDESKLIEELTSAMGLPSTVIRVRGGSVLQGALTYIDRFEVPPVSPNLFFWTPLLARAAEDGTAVMLDGEGGDELFGESIHLLSDRVRRGRLLSSLSLIRRIPGSEGTPSRKALYHYLTRYGVKGAVPYRVHELVRRRRGPRAYTPDWLLPAAAAHYAESDDAHAWKLIRGPRWYAHQLYRISRGMGPALAYDHIRRRAALAGVEPRHPLIDVDVIELVMRLPPELAFDPFLSRPLLRQSVAGLLPDSVRLRPTKSTFDAVFHESLAGIDLPAVHTLLDRPDAEVSAYVDRDKVRELVGAPPETARGMMWWALYVWRMVTIECWLLSQQGPDAVDRVLGRPLPQPRVELSA